MQQPTDLASRIFSGFFAAIFGGIGLTVLGFLWGSPFGEFHSPPLFFRIFGSLVALPFVGIGAAGLYSAITGHTIGAQSNVHQLQHRILDQIDQQQRDHSTQQIKQSDCPKCGAPRGQAEISPSGDVKCEHCQSWYNIFHSPPS